MKNWNKYIIIGILFLTSVKSIDNIILGFSILIIGLSFASYGLVIFFRDKKNGRANKTFEPFNKKQTFILLGLFSIILGFSSDSTNYISASLKYGIGILFILIGLFYPKKMI